jgi:hypothetical protein
LADRAAGAFRFGPVTSGAGRCLSRRPVPASASPSGPPSWGPAGAAGPRRRPGAADRAGGQRAGSGGQAPGRVCILAVGPAYIRAAPLGPRRSWAILARRSWPEGRVRGRNRPSHQGRYMEPRRPAALLGAAGASAGRVRPAGGGAVPAGGSRRGARGRRVSPRPGSSCRGSVLVPAAGPGLGQSLRSAVLGSGGGGRRLGGQGLAAAAWADRAGRSARRGGFASWRWGRPTSGPRAGRRVAPGRSWRVGPGRKAGSGAETARPIKARTWNRDGRRPSWGRLGPRPGGSGRPVAGPCQRPGRAEGQGAGALRLGPFVSGAGRFLSRRPVPASARPSGSPSWGPAGAAGPGLADGDFQDVIRSGRPLPSGPRQTRQACARAARGGRRYIIRTPRLSRFRRPRPFHGLPLPPGAPRR